ncbi:MAG: sulfatase-like hydrolase/transferase, partial [Planctomycetota bacterium]
GDKQSDRRRCMIPLKEGDKCRECLLVGKEATNAENTLGSSEIVIDETIRFIGKANQSQRPFFAVVWFGSPHEPYSGLDEDLALYSEMPESYRDRFVTLTSMDDGLPVRRPLHKVLEERYAEITAMDRAIGRLRRYLDDEGLRRTQPPFPDGVLGHLFDDVVSLLAGQQLGLCIGWRAQLRCRWWPVVGRMG